MKRFNRFRRIVVGGLGLLTVAGLVMVNTHGCTARPPLSGTLRPSADRSQRLTALAAQEAAQIADVDARLTRLLNLADRQLQHEWTSDGKATLAEARKTLASEDAKKLNDHARISGWVSVSELSRQADDDAAALVACEGAVAAMKAIADPAVRCDYVMGIGNELQYLKGVLAAADLLVAAGPWTKSIDNVDRRRQAVVSFAAALFNLDDYTRGQQMLRNEPDAGWRSDTLLRLASLPPASDATPAAFSLRHEAAPAASTPESSSPFFGKQLRYRDVFQGQTNSQTGN